MTRSLLFAAAAGVSALLAAQSYGAIAYSTPGSTYSENFDGLPTDAPSGANIQSASSGPYSVNGWQDDSSTVTGNHVGVPGFYLYFPTDVGAPNPPTSTNEGGTNGHQRIRFGPGANTGSFWAFGNLSTSTDKALGDVGSTTTAANGANFYTGLRLTNNTGQTLTSFTVTYDGEEWRDGQGTAGETLSFDYSLDATTANWANQAGVTPVPTYTAVSALNFTAPTVAGTGSSGTATDGNAAANRVAGITATISGVTWAPGTDLWLRWGDPQVASLADDGLAIDNVQFSAVTPEPTALGLLALGGLGLIGRRRVR